MITNNFSNFKRDKRNILRLVFESNSHEIFEYLEKRDINNLKNTNKFFYELCECNNLLMNSIRNLDKMFMNSLITDDNTDNKEKKSKFKEKFFFNKSLNSFMKGKETETFNENRIQIFLSNPFVSLSSKSMILNTNWLNMYNSP